MAFLDGIVTRAERNHFKMVLNELRQHFPKTFDPRKPLPLSEEACHEIIKSRVTNFSASDIEYFLNTWKNRYEYMCALCLHGKLYSLDGSKSTPINHTRCLDLMHRMAKLYIGAHRLSRENKKF